MRLRMAAGAIAVGLVTLAIAAPRRAIVERLTVSEQQLNEALSAELRSTPRPGIERATIKLFPGNYVSTYSRINFEEVERARPGTIPPLLRLVLHGRKDLLVDFRFESSAGTFTWAIEKAYLQNLKIPSVLIEKTIEILAERQPEHFDASKPLPLPFGVKEAWTGNHVLHCVK
ncbi:MAG: hypothetical protein NTY38_29475 [Acidobacteria bacterium]|nr:hypothetical protein [Acidobacteriota bacterium]